MSAQSDLRVPLTYAYAVIRDLGDLLKEHDALIDLSSLQSEAVGGYAAIDLLFALVDELNEKVGEQWPVKAMSAWRNQMHGTIEVAARSAETFAEALDVVTQFGPVRAPFATFTKQQVSGGSTLTFRPAVPINEHVWQALGEFVMLSTLAIFKQITDGQMAGAAAQMPARTYDHRRALEEAFGISVRFDAEHFSLRFDKDLCAAMLPFHDPALFKTASAQLDSEASRHASHPWLIEDVRRVLASARGTRPSAGDVATRLGMSQRTFVRKLAADGTSFRALLDEHLKETATKLIERGGRTLEEIAEELGYRDRTSFSRARKRWFGKVR
jgi:AraC-like DNA-binding protein